MQGFRIGPGWVPEVSSGEEVSFCETLTKSFKKATQAPILAGVHTSTLVRKGRVVTKAPGVQAGVVGLPCHTSTQRHRREDCQVPANLWSFSIWMEHNLMQTRLPIILPGWVVLCASCSSPERCVFLCYPVFFHCMWGCMKARVGRGHLSNKEARHTDTQVDTRRSLGNDAIGPRTGGVVGSCVGCDRRDYQVPAPAGWVSWCPAPWSLK